MAGKRMPKLAILGDDPVDPLVLDVFLLKAGFRTYVGSSGGDICNKLDQGDVLDCLIISASEVRERSATTIKLLRSWEISKRLKRRLPVIVIMSNESDCIRAECVAAGADAFLILPLVYSVTVNTIFELIEHSEELFLSSQPNRSSEAAGKAP